jgi:hypothetical protein
MKIKTVKCMSYYWNIKLSRKKDRKSKLSVNCKSNRNFTINYDSKVSSVIFQIYKRIKFYNVSHKTFGMQYQPKKYKRYTLEVMNSLYL